MSREEGQQLAKLEAELTRLREENEDLLRGSGSRELSLAVDLHETKRELAKLREALEKVEYALRCGIPSVEVADLLRNALKETKETS